MHTHRFIETTEGTIIEDVVRYALPFGAVGRVALPLVRRQLDRNFRYRTETVRRLLVER